jgi:hypothetical protein
MKVELAARSPLDNKDFHARQVTTPILVHLLRREMRFPKLFLFTCALTLGRFKRRIDKRFPEELVELTALPLWVYINLKKKIGQQKAFEIMRVAILTGGIVQWNLAYQAIDKERTFENLCDEELLVSKTGPTRWNTLQVMDRTPRRFEIGVTRCLYHELAQSLGIPEITPVVCQIDNAAFNSYLPHWIVFNRGGPNRTIANGKSECNFIWESRVDASA